MVAVADAQNFVQRRKQEHVNNSIGDDDRVIADGMTVNKSIDINQQQKSSQQRTLSSSSVAAELASSSSSSVSSPSKHACMSQQQHMTDVRDVCGGQPSSPRQLQRRQRKQNQDYQQSQQKFRSKSSVSKNRGWSSLSSSSSPLSSSSSLAAMRSRSILTILPTVVEEQSSQEETEEDESRNDKEENDDDDDDADMTTARDNHILFTDDQLQVDKLAVRIPNDDISSHIRSLCSPTEREVDYEHVERLGREAAVLASRGNERKAIQLYKHCLRILRRGVQHISDHMQQAASKPQFLKTATYIVLREEWTELAMHIANIRTLMAVVFERLGEHNRALNCCMEARDVYERQAKFDHRYETKGVVDAERNVHAMEHMISKIEESKESYPKRRQLYSRVTRNYEKISTKGCDLSTRTELYMDARRNIDTLLALQVAHLGGTHPDVADTKCILSKLLLEDKQFESAERNILKAISISEIALGKVHPRTAEKYEQAAKLYETVQGGVNFIKAAGLYGQAIQSYKDADGSHHARILSLMNNAGNIHMKLSDYDVAIQKLNDAIEYCKNHRASPSDRNSVLMHELEFGTWQNLVECYGDRKDQKLQIYALRSALQIQRQLRNHHSKHCSGSVEISKVGTATAIVDTLKRLGKCLADQKLYATSCSHLQEALSILRSEYDKSQKNIESTRTTSSSSVDLSMYEDGIASILYCTADVRKNNKEYSEALVLYRECLQMRLKCSSSSTNCSSSQQIQSDNPSPNHFHCAMTLSGIGSIQTVQGEHERAFRTFNQAIHYARSSGLPKHHPFMRLLWQESSMAATKMNEKLTTSPSTATRSTSIKVEV
jgi:tetratricopeptide (TPR) repeat protein